VNRLDSYGLDQTRPDGVNYIEREKKKGKKVGGGGHFLIMTPFGCPPRDRGEWPKLSY